MNEKDSYGSQYLQSEDLIESGDYRQKKLVIESVIPPGTITTASKKVIPHKTLKFKNFHQLLVLCAKVNEGMLKIVSGESDWQKWPGTEVTLEVRIVESFGEMVPAIRIIPQKGVLIKSSFLKRLGTKATLGGSVQRDKPAPATDDTSARVNKAIEFLGTVATDDALAKAETRLDELVKTCTPDDKKRLMAAHTEAVRRLKEAV